MYINKKGKGVNFMSNEISNTRIYTFLTSFNGQGGWVSAADQDGDNFIMRCEFYDFIKKNFKGEDDKKVDDLINKFWNSLDTNKSAGKIKGTSLRNLNALDKNEMENLENNLEKYITADVSNGYQSELVKKHAPYDLILANILARPLIDMAPDLYKSLKQGGYCILSGFIDEQEQWVIKTHTDLGLKLIKTYKLDNWRAALLEK